MSTSSKEMLRTRMTQYFRAHGRFCASHPWEVIVTIVTLTVCALSMSVLSGGKVGTVCGIQKPCQSKPTDQEKSDTVMLSIVNSLAVIYIYNQFSSLRKAGSKYLLAIAGLFTIFSSFVFGSTVVNFIDEKVSGLNEALPFFLLLIDLSKASALAKFAFKSRTKEEVHANIGKGIAMLGPTMTLDTVVEVLLISIGTISGVPQFETICCFGCMSLVANYLVFMTFFPASLALVLEVCPYDPGNKSWHLDELARAMQEEEKKPNPVVQRIKIIMALGLLVVHIHSRFLSSVTGLSFGFSSSGGDSVETGGGGGGEIERVTEADGEGDLVKVPLPDYLWWKVFHLTADQLVTIALAVLLFVKYIFFDKSKNFPMSVPPTPSHTLKASPSPTTPGLSSSCPFDLSQIGSGSVARRRTASSGLNISVDLPKPVRRHTSGPPEEMEKIINGGLIIRDTRTETSATQKLPLEAPNNQQSTIENCGGGGGRIGQAPKIEDKLSRADFLLGKSACVSVGVQTDPVADDTTVHTPRQSLFSIGGPSSRKDSMVSYPDSGIENGSLDIETRNGELTEPRPVSECLSIYKSDGGAAQLSDAEILQLVKAKHIPAYKLETAMGDPERGVSIRRQLVAESLATCGHPSSLDTLPYTNYNYSLVSGACCENVIGYMPIPVGYAGPLLLDGRSFHVPMSTTEGALVASTSRGCKAVSSSGGVKSSILGDGMTRGPVVRMPTAAEAASVKVWLDDMENFGTVAESFNSTSRFARLKSLQTAVAGRLVYVRFKATTGDAMGMNMLSKGVEKAIHFVQSQFPGMEVISLSGNFCTDKKPAAINWLGGRGKSVVCEATIPAQVVKQVLKTSVDALVDLNISKNLVGSAMAGSVGGFNAHAANIVSAIFIATGQDPAQNVASSNCITLMERSGPKGEDLYISCTMPSIEIGTVGGGTILPPQSACLAMLGVQGAHETSPGENATQLARIVCATVLAGELSLLSALAAGHLVKSHLTHNRSQLNLASIPEGSSEPKEHRRTHSDTESMRQATPSNTATRQQPPSPSIIRRRGSVQL